MRLHLQLNAELIGLRNVVVNGRKRIVIGEVDLPGQINYYVGLTKLG